MFANIYVELVAINVEPNLNGRTFTMSIQHKYDFMIFKTRFNLHIENLVSNSPTEMRSARSRIIFFVITMIILLF